jgi:hypothetical protein
MNEIRIPYKPNKILFIFVIVFFGAITGLGWHEAINNDRGLILNGIQLSQQQANVLYWFIAGSSLLFVLAGLCILVNSFTSNKEIVISNNAITLPKHGFSNTNITVNFSDITNLTLQSIKRTKILNIEYSGGKPLAITDSMLPNKKTFEELIYQLQSRVNT